MGIENTTESWDLSANVEVGRCSQGWSGAVESIAPGCLGQCARYGICASIGKVVGVWTRTHSKDKAKRKACEAKKAFDCLLWGSHRKLCQPLIDRAPKFGIPTNVNQACPRRLDETPAQDVVAQASELTQSTEVPDEHASEDNSGCNGRGSSQFECAGMPLHHRRIEAMWHEMLFQAWRRAHWLYHRLPGQVASPALVLRVLCSKVRLHHEQVPEQVRICTQLEEVHRLCPLQLWRGLPLNSRSGFCFARSRCFNIVLLRSMDAVQQRHRETKQSFQSYSGWRIRTCGAQKLCCGVLVFGLLRVVASA